MQTELGIIEGFYGKLYTKEQRESLCSFISKNGYSYYIYAPKNDKSLRSCWDAPFSKQQLSDLKNLCDYCHNQGLKFGVGISPLKLTENYENKLPLFLNKIDSLVNEVQVDIIAVLFDDIKLYTSSEGMKQNLIVKTVFNRFNVNGNNKLRIIFCPTYYSFDPILEKLFGARPEHYFKDLMEGLDKNIEVFWTGNKVLSKSITKEDIENINQLLGRKVTIWDNYPVNDGKKISTYIYTKEFENRSELDGVVLSHAVNPMLEAELSKVSVATLPLLYKGCSALEIKLRQQECLKELFKDHTEALDKYLMILNDNGLAGLDEANYKELYRLCKDAADNNLAIKELKDFLDGVYKFDEACLTS